MQYAEVNGEKVEAERGRKGSCPLCYGEVFAKCGEYRINHWAHKSKISCDEWWERETEWHRRWKNKFPKEWQEVVLHDEKTGEKHIADIRSNDGIVIEFQHSPIVSQERRSRENFYKKMIWVVDGTRNKRDYMRFAKGYPQIGTVIGVDKRIESGGHFETIKEVDSDPNEKVPFRQGITARELYGKKEFITEKYVWVPDYIVEDEIFTAEKCLPHDWANCSTPVVFDFFNGEEGEFRETLWAFNRGEIYEVSRDEFVRNFSELFNN
jgi:hypothetical protein